MVFGLFESKSKKRSYSKKNRGTKKTKTMKHSNKKTMTKKSKKMQRSKRTMKGGEAVEFKLDSHIGGLPEVVRGTHDCK